MSHYLTKEQLAKKGMLYESDKKQESRQIIKIQHIVPKSESMAKLDFNPDEDQLLYRNAILSITTSKYLRACVLTGENDSEYRVTIFQNPEEPLEELEFRGVLANADEKTIPLKEEGIRYYLPTTTLRTMISEEIKNSNLTHLSLANIHHDYVRYFNRGDSLEGVMLYHLLNNGVES